MKTTRSHSRRVAFYAVITLLLTLIPSAVQARDVAAAGHASLHSAPYSAPRNALDEFYRGAWNIGSVWKLGTFEENKIAAGSTRYGVSVYNQAGFDAGKLDRFTCIYRFIRGNVPLTLKVQQRGIDPEHFEIMPRASMTVADYVDGLTQILLVQVKGNRYC